MPKHNITERVTTVATSSFRGPLPPPDALARYEQICPGFADRIVALAEREAENRQRLERENMRIAENDIVAARNETKHGQNLAFWITIRFCGCSWLCLFKAALGCRCDCRNYARQRRLDDYASKRWR